MVVKSIKKGLKKLIYKFQLKRQKGLLVDFQQAKQKILEANSRFIIEEHLVPYIIDTTLYSEGYLMSEKQAYELATEMFLRGKATGRIDSMNRLTKELV